MPLELRRINALPTVNVESLSNEDVTRFEKLRVGVELYLGGGRIGQKLRDLGLTFQEVQRAANRAVSLHPDGRLFGFRALIPHMRTRAYRRTKAIGMREPGAKGGYSGALSTLLNKPNGIEDALATYLVDNMREGGAKEAPPRHKEILEYFHELCRKAGVRDDQWPFNTDGLGKSALYRYVIRFFQDNYDAIVEARYGLGAQAKSRTGTGHRGRLLATAPYDVVEVDEHRGHFIGAMRIRTNSGWRWVAIRRVILITVTDRRSGAVLGYHAVFKREADSDDLLAALHDALRKWQPREFHLPGQSYDEGAGFPSGRLDGLAGCGWGVLLFDNALIHLAKDVIDRVRNLVGCDISYGPVRRFERRAVGELVFKRLSEQGFERVESTTGSKAGDVRRQDAERKAVKGRLSMYAMLDLIELTIAHYNHVVTKRCDGISALDYFEYWATDPDFDAILPRLPERPSHVPALNIAVVRVRISGDPKKGRAPSVSFEEAKYTSPHLSRAWRRVGEWVDAHVDPDDIRTIRLFSLKGDCLGEVTALDFWAEEPHSRDIRRMVNAQTAAGKLPKAKGPGFLRRFMVGLAEEAANEAKRGGVSDSATRLANEEAKRSRRKREPVPAVGNDDVYTPPPPRAVTREPVATAAHGRRPGESDRYVAPLVRPTRIKAIN
ncbi:hypothetical protein PAGU2595_013260 [Lysobacter xanthus]